MYDELVKELRHIDEFATETNRPTSGIFREAADAIETLEHHVFLADLACKAEAAKAPRWIPVTEEPPLKVGDDGYNGYLVYANGYYEIADYTTDKFDNVPYFHVDGEYEPGVTHFMPLPEPPKDKT